MMHSFVLYGMAGIVLGAAGSLFAQPVQTRPAGGPVRIGVVGLEHGHVYGFLQDAVKRTDIRIVGMAEPAPELLRRYGKHHHQFPDSVLFAELDGMLDAIRPEAVAVFTDTFDHLAVVEACARRKIHVMVEKPLAANIEHARGIERAARDSGIHVVVNYETTWYPNTQAGFRIAAGKSELGPIRKLVFHDGHRGPKELGMPREFLAWLTDPVRNGGGAMVDFGCYGACLATCLMGTERPLAVTAVAQQFKSDPEYARVEDEATLVVTYPKAQAIIQASWNWPFDRKDMEIYGERGTYQTIGRDLYRLRPPDGPEKQAPAEPLDPPFTDPISYLAAVARGRIVPAGPSSLEVNLIVEQILDAARRSVATGRTVKLNAPSGAHSR